MVGNRDEKKTLVHILEVIGILIGISILLFTLDSFIDRKIDKAISNTDYISKISAYVRPSIIFSSTDQIIVDLGGLSFIENIHVETDSIGQPTKVILESKSWLPYAPILTSADEALYSISEKRGVGMKWTYDLKFTLATIENYDGTPRLSYPGTDGKPFKFRLEVIH